MGRKRGPVPEMISVGDRRMTIRQACRESGLSDFGVRYRVGHGLQITPKGQPLPKPEKKKEESIQSIRNRYASEVADAFGQPGSILTARDVALAAFDYGLAMGSTRPRRAS